MNDMSPIFTYHKIAAIVEYTVNTSEVVMGTITVGI